MGFAVDFTSTFWFTGIIDGIFVILYLVFASYGGLKTGELFLPIIGKTTISESVISQGLK
jgi:hypothetical protein